MFKQIKATEQKWNVSLGKFVDNVNGKIGVPILLYFLGVPGIICVLLWAFIFRGK